MKISEYISHLTALGAVHGDLDMYVTLDNKELRVLPAPHIVHIKRVIDEKRERKPMIFQVYLPEDRRGAEVTLLWPGKE